MRRRAAPRPPPRTALPFLRNTEVIVLPIGAFALIALAAVVIGFNPSVSSARFFFVPDDDLD
jgi:hypothetical protein